MPGRIEDYALIGDLETAALVGRDGSIDWLCWPRFDSDACFAALLGDARHGRWIVTAKQTDAIVTRRYREDSLLLETRFATSTGSVVVVDFMPPRDSASDLVRIVVGESGEVQMWTELVIRFGYGASVPWLTRIADDTWRAVAGPDSVMLRTRVPMRGHNLAHAAHFTIRKGETASFVLTYVPSHLDVPAAPDIDPVLDDTERFWRDWVGRGKVTKRWSKAVTRSLITLRALVYEPTGGIVAAPTASLPEQIGGARNWDYRFCWLRDATLTLLAFMNAGYYKEAEAWRHWLLRAIAGSAEDAQINLSLVATAFNLAQTDKPAEQRSESEIAGAGRDDDGPAPRPSRM